MRIVENALDSGHEVGVITLRTGARRIDFYEEFLHFRIFRDKDYLLELRQDFKRQLSKSFGHKIAQIGGVSEELAVKTHMINNAGAFGLHPEDIVFLQSQVSWILKTGQINVY